MSLRERRTLMNFKGDLKRIETTLYGQLEPMTTDIIFISEK